MTSAGTRRRPMTLGHRACHAACRRGGALAVLAGTVRARPARLGADGVDRARSTPRHPCAGAARTAAPKAKPATLPVRGRRDGARASDMPEERKVAAPKAAPRLDGEPGDRVDQGAARRRLLRQHRQSGRRRALRLAEEDAGRHGAGDRQAHRGAGGEDGRVPEVAGPPRRVLQEGATRRCCASTRACGPMRLRCSWRRWTRKPRLPF